MKTILILFAICSAIVGSANITSEITPVYESIVLTDGTVYNGHMIKTENGNMFIDVESYIKKVPVQDIWNHGRDDLSQLDFWRKYLDVNKEMTDRYFTTDMQKVRPYSIIDSKQGNGRIDVLLLKNGDDMVPGIFKNKMTKKVNLDSVQSLVYYQEPSEMRVIDVIRVNDGWGNINEYRGFITENVLGDCFIIRGTAGSDIQKANIECITIPVGKEEKVPQDNLISFGKESLVAGLRIQTLLPFMDELVFADGTSREGFIIDTDLPNDQYDFLDKFKVNLFDSQRIKRDQVKRIRKANPYYNDEVAFNADLKQNNLNENCVRKVNDELGASGAVASRPEKPGSHEREVMVNMKQVMEIPYKIDEAKNYVFEKPEKIVNVDVPTGKIVVSNSNPFGDEDVRLFRLGKNHIMTPIQHRNAVDVVDFKPESETKSGLAETYYDGIEPGEYVLFFPSDKKHYYFKALE